MRRIDNKEAMGKRNKGNNKQQQKKAKAKQKQASLTKQQQGSLEAQIAQLQINSPRRQAAKTMTPMTMRRSVTMDYRNSLRGVSMKSLQSNLRQLMIWNVVMI